MSYVEDFVLVDVTAGQSAHNALNASDIKGVIKVDNMGEGTHVVEVLFELNDEVYKVAPALVEVEIEAVKSSEEDNSESIDDGGNNSTQTGTTNSETTESTESAENSEVTEKNETTDTKVANTEVTEKETQTTSEATGE